MSRILKSLLAVFGSAGLASAAQADPGETISKLLNARLNWFTYGLAELGERMERLPFELTDPETSPSDFTLGGARYDETSRQIVLQIRMWRGSEKSDADTECSNMVRVVRQRGGIDLETGQLRKGLEYSVYAGEFISEGFPLKHIGAADGQALDNIMSIEVSLTVSDKPSTLKCRAPLIGKDHSIER